MKKFGLFLIVFALFCGSCEKDNVLLQNDEINDNKEVKTEQPNYRISIDEAINEVNSLLDAIDNNTGNGNTVMMQTAGRRRTIKDVEVATKPHTGLTLMNATAGNNENTDSADTLFYVINFEDNQGFAIASADQRLEPVLCVTEEGNFYLTDAVYNPGLASFLDGLDAYITDSMVVNRPPNPIGGGGRPCLECPEFPEPPTAIHYPYTESTWTQVNEKLKVRWDQNPPYNANCPINMWKLAILGITERYYTGCVATALAQIMSYYQYPLNHGSFTYNWTEMLKLGSYPLYNDYYSTTAINNVAHLMYNDIGLGVDMEYSSDGSSASIKDARDYIRSRGYSCSSIANYNIDNIINALNQNKLVYSRGYSKKHSFLGITLWYSGGHAWVIDGYIKKVVTTHVDEYTSYTTTTKYVHCNWGWRGTGNGYFIGKAFETRYFPDTGTGSANTGYVYDNEMMIINR
jgi:hypothetical protein